MHLLRSLVQSLSGHLNVTSIYLSVYLLSIFLSFSLSIYLSIYLSLSILTLILSPVHLVALLECHIELLIGDTELGPNVLTRMDDLFIMGTLGGESKSRYIYYISE